MASLRYQPLSIVFLTVKELYWEKDDLPISMLTDGFIGAVLTQRFGEAMQEVTGLSVFARGAPAQKWDKHAQDMVLQ